MERATTAAVETGSAASAACTRAAASSSTAMGPFASCPRGPLLPSTAPCRPTPAARSRMLLEAVPRGVSLLRLFVRRLLRFVEEGHRLQFDFLDRLEVVEDPGRVLAADLGVEVKTEPVGPPGVDQSGLESQKGLDRIEQAHHRGAEEIDPGASGQEQLDDVAPTHVRGP